MNMIDAISDIHCSCKAVRDMPDKHLSPGDARIIASAWRWAHKESVPDTPSNRESVRFYWAQTERIARTMRGI